MGNFNTCDSICTDNYMPGVYVLISSEIGYENVIIDELKAIPQAIEAFKIYGSSYDIIAKFSSDSPEKLRKVLSSIRRLDKIRSTQTMMIIES
jgi:DNA-binding Lrp family transcriptional regulator